MALSSGGHLQVLQFHKMLHRAAVVKGLYWLSAFGTDRSGSLQGDKALVRSPVGQRRVRAYVVEEELPFSQLGRDLRDSQGAAVVVLELHFGGPVGLFRAAVPLRPATAKGERLRSKATKLQAPVEKLDTRVHRRKASLLSGPAVDIGRVPRL